MAERVLYRSSTEKAIKKIDPSNDDIEVKGIYLQDSNQSISIDGSNNLTFVDSISGTQTLADLLAGGGTHLVPAAKNSTEFTLQKTEGDKILLNNSYFTLTNDLDVNYNTSATGTWYICVDADLSEGEINSSYVKFTQVDPGTNDFNRKYVVLGEYSANASGYVDDSLNGYSTREMNSWLDSVQNIDTTYYQQVTSSGAKTYNHGQNQIPLDVRYIFYDDSANIYYHYSRSDIETSLTDNAINYIAPNDRAYDADDYFEVRPIFENQAGAGLASPKSDYETDWYTVTPSGYVEHTLGVRPMAIVLEWEDTVGSAFTYVTDGDQYVEKSAGKGITQSGVHFDWTGLPTVSGTLRLKIHLYVSVLSSGAFAATATVLGTIKITGNTTVPTPDLILYESDTDVASQINDLGHNKWIHIDESIIVTSEQEITASGLKLTSSPGAYIISASAIASVIKLSGQDYIIDELNIETQENITSGLEINEDGIVKSILVKMNGSGKTLTQAVLINTSTLATVDGRTKAVDGTITNKFTDTDGNSEIRIS